MPLKEYFNPKIKKIKVDFSSACNANCIGCYTHAAKQDPKVRLSFKELDRIIEFASKNGFKQLVIGGLGEPLIDKKYFFRFAECADKHRLEVILYDNGTLIDSNIAARLFNMSISILVKRNSMDNTKQNYFMGVKSGLAEKNWWGIQNLKKAGFKSDRLAIESYISKQNVDDLCEVLRFCRQNDITPYFEEFICVDQTSKMNQSMVLSGNDLLRAYRKYQKIDKKEFGISTSISRHDRRYGIHGCFAKQMMSIDVEGNIKQCIFDKIYGNIAKDDLAVFHDKIPKKCQGCSLAVIEK